MMTELLEKAFSEAAKVPKEEQDLLAEWLLEELSVADSRWDESFGKSRDKLRKMAAEALEDYQQGRTEPLSL